MKEIRITDIQTIRFGRLDEELRDALGQKYQGMATDGQGLRIFFEPDPTQTEQARAKDVVAAHDASQLSEAEAAEKALVDFIEGLNLQNELATIDAIADLASAKTYLRRLVRGVIHLARLMGYAVVVEET